MVGETLSNAESCIQAESVYPECITSCLTVDMHADQVDAEYISLELINPLCSATTAQARMQISYQIELVEPQYSTASAYVRDV